MSAWMKETVREKKKRTGQDKGFQEWKGEDVQLTQVKVETQPGQSSIPPTWKSKFRFEEWENEVPENTAKNSTVTIPLPAMIPLTGRGQIQEVMDKTQVVSPNAGKALWELPETETRMSESTMGSTHHSGTFMGEERFSPAPQINHAERNTPGVDYPGVLAQYDRDLTALRTEALDRAAAELTSRAKAMESLADECVFGGDYAISECKTAAGGH